MFRVTAGRSGGSKVCRPRGPWTPPRPTGRPGAEGCLPNRQPPALGKQSPLPPGPSQGSCNPSAAPGTDGLQKNEGGRRGERRGGGRKEGGGEGLLWQVMSLQFAPQHVVPVPISPSRRLYFTEKTWPGRPLRCPGGRPEKALLTYKYSANTAPSAQDNPPGGLPGLGLRPREGTPYSGSSSQACACPWYSLPRPALSLGLSAS